MSASKTHFACATMLTAALSLPVAADDLVSAASDMCEKVKTCMLAQMNEADLTPEMRQMMEPMAASMCDQMRQGIGEMPTGHALYEPAVACMRSVANLSCEAFQEGSSAETPECKKYRELAKQTYGE